jgi:nucleoside-diphosphate-sugar epimerase
VKVFLTGATGFIGSHVARQLVRAGHQVHALVRPGSNRWRIADIESNLQIVEADLLSSSFRLPADSFELCIHLAWYVEPGQYLHSPLNQQYLHASRALAKLFPRFVGAGTCFEYALTGQPLTETSPTAPRTPYARAKLELFQSLPANAAWVRFFYQYGPAEDARRLVPVVIHSLLRGEPARLVPGDRVRDFLHVADVASAVCAVATSGLSGAVNIGSGERTTVRDVAGKIGELLGRPELLQFGAIPYRPDEPLDIVADNTKLRSTGWRPRFNLETGLRDTIQWWRQARSQTPTR